MNQTRTVHRISQKETSSLSSSIMKPVILAPAHGTFAIGKRSHWALTDQLRKAGSSGSYGGLKDDDVFTEHGFPGPFCLSIMF